ncbi:MAG: hypothetical protein LPJ96_08865 [Exiguobacterium sp.]|uniref:Prepilin-type N-terminal cleavage/methylation domain-containing protein n=1 Tax=Exiguobacterium alkaliphilum TaxID=1428684 RepID=A0ABT2L172_9BACL|nr:hypothetical protein [Exiguobacterium alkaliphilum]MDX5323711.1 hypothetical protein [Exiguobacterium sp.]MCT4795585.1 hypothetical protein [Exiguobacterium alkaliphilum]MDX5425519.1 hypothetical protein [Exiguobacterium sp.]MDX6772928.1 hypothetical protein [Exiguobacterium sp.]QUE85101.1 hypothetical protein KB235_07745 [Exiguobacterium alkaliphilum]
MRGFERGVTLWEICLSLALLLGWIGVLVPFIVNGNERIERLEATVRQYEALQREVLIDAANPSGRGRVCVEELCLPTL